jgi:hypothetical protein
MYGIRKFINHIYKIIGTGSKHYRIYIHVFKYKYVIDNITKTHVKIYTKKLRYIQIIDYVIKYKKNYIYNYNYIKNNKLIMGNDDINITIIDDGIHITHYNEIGDHINDIVITHDNVLIF